MYCLVQQLFLEHFGFPETEEAGLPSWSLVLNMWVKAVEKVGSTDVDVVRPAMYGITYPNLTGGIAVMNTNHHLTKPVLIGEIQADGQFETVWQTSGGVIGDAWTDHLPDSARLVADWSAPIMCGNFNIDTSKCSGQNY